MHASKRRYALCTGIPFVFVVITVFTAGVMSIQSWWHELGTVPPEQRFLLKLACVLASAMLLLSATIVVNAVWRWFVILGRPVSRPVPGALAGE
jgi:carbon starvation protein CstA